MKAKDISTGMKFNSWEIINRIKNKGTIPYFVCKCDCGTIKEVSCSNLVRGQSKSCGCVKVKRQRQKIANELEGKQFGDLKVICFEGVDKFQHTLWKCECFCGNFKIIPRSALVTGNTKTCGCSHSKEKAGLRNRIDISGQKFNKLTVINYSHSVPTVKNGIKKTSSAHWNCVCDCGNKITAPGSSLKNGHTRSCGCLKQDLIEKRILGKSFGRLKAISMSKRNKRRRIWKCLCECGKETFVSTNSLNRGDIKSCGNCKLIRKGVKTSSKALELNKMIGKGIHNYKTKCGPCIDIALSYNGQKVGIEYDEWYWHGGRQQEDAIRIQKLIESGWKIIQIKASQNLPTIEQINEALNALNNVNHYIIQLPNWGTRKYFKQGEDTDVS